MKCRILGRRSLVLQFRRRYRSTVFVSNGSSALLSLEGIKVFFMRVELLPSFLSSFADNPRRYSSAPLPVLPAVPVLQ